MNEYTKSNLAMWNEWAELHATSGFYDVQSFKAGKSKLKEIERAELTDVAGKSLLHMQCHFGLDTLSWAREGATVTGADFSDTAIALARALSDELHIPARFVQSEITALPEVLDDQFDIVYTSYGVLCWLPDLDKWAQAIAHFLKPGGTFYIVEYHPFFSIFEDRQDGPGVDIKYSYFPSSAPLRFPITGSYAATIAEPKNTVEYNWNHSLSEIITALIGAGLRIEFLHEFDYMNFKPFRDMDEFEPKKWRMANTPAIPLMFSIKATKL